MIGGFPPFGPGHRALVQSNGRGRDLRRTDVRAPEEPKTSGVFLFYRSPESCLQNAPRSLGVTWSLGGRLLELGWRDAAFTVPEPFGIERLLLPQHVIDGPTQTRGQD